MIWNDEQIDELFLRRTVRGRERGWRRETRSWVDRHLSESGNFPSHDVGNQHKQSFSTITPISSVYSPIFHIISKLTLSQILKNGLRFMITNGQNSYTKAFLLHLNSFSSSLDIIL
ncbi:hypothetical protein PNOK_0761000 [Pyrrhoderma noxium]|uniref:Uncharacterized protein n=1 Tax=Pyrrhoderma noxium TaxID=2282107 RepID=A0A286UDH2_9AGAM|nr:hypothetical protein PNOK_0761000 [Pyrrhoderma noxium]